MSAMDDDDLLRKVAAELGRTIEEAREQVRIAREIREQAQLKLSMTERRVARIHKGRAPKAD